MRQALLKDKKVKKGEPTSAYFYYASIYESSKIEVLKWLQSQSIPSQSTPGGIDFPADTMKLIKPWLEGQPDLKKMTKDLMQFASFMKNEALDRGADALAEVLPFDQRGIFEETLTYIKSSLNLEEISFYNLHSGTSSLCGSN